MPFVTHNAAMRMAKRLKRTLREEFGQDARLHMCQKAVAAGFHQQHVHTMISSVPCDMNWSGERAVRLLVDKGFVPNEPIARLAVAELEARIRYVDLGGVAA